MWDPLTRTLLTLTFVTGILDAVAFLALGNVFVAMQTGNVIFLGIGLGGAAGAPVLAPLVALAAFLAGGCAAALFVRPLAPGHPAGLASAMLIEVALLAFAALLAALGDVEPGAFLAYLLIALLAVAMGLRNTIARRIGDPSLVTTVLNLTVTAFASHAPLALASRGELETRGVAIGAILVGALCGALLLKASLALALTAAAVVVTVAAVSFLRADSAGAARQGLSPGP
jgi:uncharacterized membrane protein YoaK (UPF0700 family)